MTTTTDGTTVTDQMKVRIDRAVLAEAAAWVSGAISKNPSSPAMAGMRIEAGDGLVRLSGFDYDTARRATVEGDVKTPGEALVSGKFLVQIVSAMKGETAELTLAGSQLTIASGRSTYRTQTMVVTEYPELPEFPTHVGTINAEMLMATLGTAEHAVSKDPNLAAMAAYNIVGNAGMLTVTTTDRFRMARATSKWADASAADFEANVPGTALHTAVKGLAGDVQIGFRDGSFGLSDPTRSIVTRVLGTEERFPSKAADVLFSTEPLIQVEVDVPPLVEALKRALLISDDNQLVIVEFSDSLITVRADSKINDGTEEVDCEPGFGEGEMALKFNASYLTQALLASPSQRVRFGMRETNTPVLIHPVGDGTAMFMVAPRGNL